eukprot:4285748-Prymnesium_polylepis.1
MRALARQDERGCLAVRVVDVLAHLGEVEQQLHRHRVAILARRLEWREARSVGLQWVSHRTKQHLHGALLPMQAREEQRVEAVILGESNVGAVLDQRSADAKVALLRGAHEWSEVVLLGNVRALAW